MGADTTTINIANTPIVGGILKLQLPVAGMKVEVRHFDASCAATGGLCAVDVLTANSAGEVPVELGVCNAEGICGWWDRVRLDCRLQTGIAYYDVDDDGNVDPLASAIDLFPESQPADRLANLTVTGDAWKTRILAGLGRVGGFYAQTYGFAPPTMRLYIAGSYSFSVTEGMAVENDSSALSEGSVEHSLAHEYAHAIQDASSTGTFGILGVPCCPSGCTHYNCNNVECLSGPFTEGMAEGMAEYFYRTVFGQVHTGFDYPCGPGGQDENNVAYFVYLMSTRDPSGFLATYQRTRGVHSDPFLLLWLLPATMQEYWDAWNGIDDPAAYDVSVFHPGTFNAQQFYNLAINRIVAGVQSDVAAGGAPGNIVHIQGVPGHGRFTVRLRAERDGVARLRVYSISGRLVHETALRVGGERESRYVLDLSSVSSGVYLVNTEFPPSRASGTSQKIVILR